MLALELVIVVSIAALTIAAEIFLKSPWRIRAVIAGVIVGLIGWGVGKVALDIELREAIGLVESRHNPRHLTVGPRPSAPATRRH